MIIVKDMEKVEFYLNVCKDEFGCLCVVVVMFVGEEGLEWFEVLLDVGVDVLVVDIVYGYLFCVIEVVDWIKKLSNYV